MFFKKKEVVKEEPKIYYINLRCKKCGEVISKRQTSINFNPMGYMVGKDCHDCPQSTKDEYVVCEPVSVSGHPIGKIFSWE